MAHISLPSNASLKYFPDNVGSNYRVKMHDTFPILNSTEEYECAVSEVILPTSVRNIPKRQRIRVTFKNLKEFKIPAVNFTSREHRHQLEWGVPPGAYTMEALMYEINMRAPSWGGYSSEFRYDSVKDRVYIQGNEKTAFIVRIRMDPILASILGFRTEKFYKTPNKRVKLQQIIAPYPSAVKGGLATLYIYTDIIAGQYVGEVRTPLLRIVNWTHAKNANTASIIFDRPIFCPLLTNRFDTIQIVIMNDQGQEIKFESGTVVVILEFRPKSI